MALRSGYKGIKKLAEGLRWNRPGILAADEAELAKVFFPRSEQAVLGAKNVGRYVNAHVEGDDNEGYQIVSGGGCLIAEVKNNTQYIASRKNNQGNRFRINLFVNYPSSTHEAGSSQIINDPTKNGYEFNTGNFNYVVFTYDNSTSVITQDTAEAMISLDGGEYAPPAITNKELTDAITPINGIGLVELANGIGGSISSESYLYKFGKLVVAYIQLLGITASMNDYIMTLPEGYRPRKIINVAIKKAGDDNLHLGQVMSNGNVQIAFGISNANYTLLATSWVTQ